MAGGFSPTICTACSMNRPYWRLEIRIVPALSKKAPERMARYASFCPVEYVFKNVGANTLTVAKASSQLIYTTSGTGATTAARRRTARAAHRRTARVARRRASLGAATRRRGSVVHRAAASDVPSSSCVASSHCRRTLIASSL